MVNFIENSETSGMGKWAHRVAEELGRSNHHVEMWFAGDFPKLARCGRLGRQGFPLALAQRIMAARRLFDVAIIHEPGAIGYGVLRWCARGLPGMVVLSHGVESRAFSQMLEAKRHGFAHVSTRNALRNLVVRRWQSNGALRLADHVVCVSSVDREYLVKRLGVDPNGVSLAITGAEKLPQVAEPGSMRVAFIGSWIAEKGSYSLPRIWSLIVRTFPDARLSILGSGIGASTVLAAFSEDTRATVTVVPTFGDSASLVELIRGAAVMLLPSMREGSPLALLEAMAMGLAPIASRVGGVPDILVGELSSFLFDRFDVQEAAGHVVRLLGDSRRTARMGRLARQRAIELTWARTASVVEDACVHAASRVRTIKPA